MCMCVRACVYVYIYKINYRLQTYNNRRYVIFFNDLRL